MKKFIAKTFHFSLIGLIPLSIVGVMYLYFDPFKVLHDYDSFYIADANATVNLDKDYVSTTTFINNSKKINYNSFIFGNSRSLFYQISDWKMHLSENAVCFHFDASAETLWAINKKVEFLDKKGINIENILLILDYSTLIQDKPKSGHLFIISPALVDNSNILEFHKTFFSAFLTPKFFLAFLDYKISNQIKPYMTKNYLLDDRPRKYDTLTNEIRFDHYEKLIKENRYYTPQRLSVFYGRDTTNQQYSPECIFESQKSILNNIASITKKHNSEIKVIINPLYDQKKINENDLKCLKKIFGSVNVYDFSGINEFTNDYKNYYESSHYRPHIARKILSIIYQ